MAQKFYVVWSGRQTGVFTDWTTTQRAVDNRRIEEELNLTHVAAHVGTEGNELADRMATLGVQSKEKRTAAAVSGKNRYFDVAQDAGGVNKKAPFPQKFVSLMLNQCKEELKRDSSPFEFELNRHNGAHCTQPSSLLFSSNE